MLDHLSDRELEEVFKKVSESREFEYNPDAWKLIKPRLEKKKKRRRFLIWFWGMGIAAILIAGLFYITNRSTTASLSTDHLISNEISEASSLIEKKEVATTENSNYKNQASDNTLTADNIDVSQASPQTVELAIAPAIIPDDNTTAQLSSTASKNTINKNTTGTPNRGTPGTNDLSQTGQQVTQIASSTISGGASSGINSDSNSNSTPGGNSDTKLTTSNRGGLSTNNNSTSDDIAVANTTNVADETSTHNKVVDAATSPTSAITMTAISRLPIANFLIAKPHHVITIDTTAILERIEATTPSIGIELQLGQEWSTTNTSYFRSGDTRIGLGLSYPISNKLAVMTGVGYRSDSYWAGAGAYRPIKGFWEDGIPPVSTSAVCQILDIPIGLNYHYSGVTESGFFSSVAVTSIFMLREDYNFNYNPNTPGQVESWSGVNANQHLFNDLYLSSGYQVKLSDNYFIKFAPYFQIPLQGIGHGNLELYTLGAKLSVAFQSYR